MTGGVKKKREYGTGDSRLQRLRKPLFGGMEGKWGDTETGEESVREVRKEGVVHCTVYPCSVVSCIGTV